MEAESGRKCHRPKPPRSGGFGRGHLSRARTLDAALDAEFLLDVFDAVQHILKLAPMHHLITQGVLWSVETLCERHAALRYEGVMDYLSFVLEEGDYLSQCLRT